MVEIDGTVVTDTHRPVLFFETGLPTRYYIPREDVRLDLLEATDHHTGCPYKGTAEYWSWRSGADVPPNLVWSYPDPLPAVGAIQGLLAFYNEAVDITLDGERVERPVTHFTNARARALRRYAPAGRDGPGARAGDSRTTPTETSTTRTTMPMISR